MRARTWGVPPRLPAVSCQSSGAALSAVAAFAAAALATASPIARSAKASAKDRSVDCSAAGGASFLAGLLAAGRAPPGAPRRVLGVRRAAVLVGVTECRAARLCAAGAGEAFAGGLFAGPALRGRASRLGPGPAGAAPRPGERGERAVASRRALPTYSCSAALHASPDEPADRSLNAAASLAKDGPVVIASHSRLRTSGALFDRRGTWVVRRGTDAGATVNSAVNCPDPVTRQAEMGGATYLAGDIGGTNTRLLLTERPDTALADNDHTGERVLAEGKYPSGDFRHLSDIIHAFLDRHADCRRPSVCVLAVAGPVVNNTCRVTNVKRWPVLDGAEMAKDLRVGTVLLMNDFAAIGYGLLDLPEEGVRPLSLSNVPRPRRVHGAPMACLGAGTGLGQCFLTHNGSEYDVYPTEGGHASFAPRNVEEMDLMRTLMRRGLRTVSVERVCSGSALPDMYEYYRMRYPNVENPLVTEELAAAAHEPGAVIGARGVDGSDQLCRRTLELFVSIYGAEAGNLALKTIPYGGLYIAGGIATKIMPAMLAGDNFMLSMVCKGRMRSVLERVPVYVVTHKNVGMLGACVMSRRVLRKGLPRRPVAPARVVPGASKL